MSDKKSFKESINRSTHPAENIITQPDKTSFVKVFEPESVRNLNKENSQERKTAKANLLFKPSTKKILKN